LLLETLERCLITDTAARALPTSVAVANAHLADAMSAASRARHGVLLIFFAHLLKLQLQGLLELERLVAGLTAIALVAFAPIGLANTMPGALVCTAARRLTLGEVDQCRLQVVLAR